MLSIGFSNYVLWEDLGSSASPHIMYGTYLLGTLGTFWMGIVSLFAVISTANTLIASLAGIVCAMSEIELLPKVFVKRNKKKVPYFGVLLIAAIMLVINITGLTEAEEIAFIILVSSIFMLLAYIVVHINVIIMRIKQPKAERTFKVPGGIVLPCIGIVGIIAMIFQIDPDPSVRASIYMVCGLVALVIGIYAFIWIKIINREKLFKPMSVEEVYALENQDSMEKADYKEVFS
jgi:amino acid transporter